MDNRKVVVFTGADAGPAVIEHVEAIARAFPRWDVHVVQEAPPRGRGGAASWLRRMRPPLRRRRVPTVSGAVGLPASLAEPIAANVSYRRCAGLRDRETVEFVRGGGFWLGIAIEAPDLGPDLVALPELGVLSLRKGSTPAGRGTSPGFWELRDGARTTSAEVHWLGAGQGEGVGAVLRRREIPIPAYATVAGLRVLLDVLGTDVLLDALRGLEDGRRKGAPPSGAVRPPERRPSWWQARTLQHRLRGRRRRPRSPAALARRSVKFLAMTFFTTVYAAVRNHRRARRGASRTAILLYHRINDERLDPLTVGVEQFDRQLSILKRSYDVVDLATFRARRGGFHERPTVLITFDDGYEDNYVAAVLLRRHGLPAAFFVSTGIVGTDRGFPHDLQALGLALPALSWEQVARMKEWGFEIGNHTVDHTRVSSPPADVALAEIGRAQEDLEARLGPSAATRSFAYPYGKRGDVTEDVRAGLPGLGVELCLSAYGGVNEPEFDPWDVLRSPVDGSMSDLTFRAVVEGWSKPV